MILDRGHLRWGVATGLLAFASAVLYAIYARAAPSGPRGGSWPGLCFGIAGSSLMVFAALLGARRRLRTWRLGRATSWLKGHVWLGLLSVPLILFHAGFSAGGPLTTVLLILLIVVTGSGVIGLALQQFLPRLMSEQVPLETVYEEIPHVCEQLRAEADRLVVSVCGDLDLEPVFSAPDPSGSEPAEENELMAQRRASPLAAPDDEADGSGPLRDFYLSRVRPYLGPAGRGDDELSRREAARDLFDRLRLLVPPALHGTVEELTEICEERRQLQVQGRLHGWLHGWLLVHVPLTMALLVLGAFHAVWALRY